MFLAAFSSLSSMAPQCGHHSFRWVLSRVLYPHIEHLLDVFLQGRRLPSLLPIAPCTLSVVAVAPSSSCSSWPDSFWIVRCLSDRVFSSRSVSRGQSHIALSLHPRLFSWIHCAVVVACGSVVSFHIWRRRVFLSVCRFS